ncbi:MAG TPA: sigma-70 family RNA polymerase sigma factor [Acidimicrobiia bacterium]|nr:sigma-70 family RNA polymerase sigma factor [Acidimicrobiia bacterium]
MSSIDDRFRQIYGAYFKEVHAYCRRRTTPDGADDATAETFLIAWRRIDRVPEGPEALMWLYRTARGVVSNTWRGALRQKNLNRKLAGLGLDPVPMTDEVVILRHDADRILQALSRLRAKEQEVLRLAEWEDLSPREIAAVLDISPEAARQRLSRARAGLARHYNRLFSDAHSHSIAQEGGMW